MHAALVLLNGAPAGVIVWVCGWVVACVCGVWDEGTAWRFRAFKVHFEAPAALQHWLHSRPGQHGRGLHTGAAVHTKAMLRLAGRPPASLLTCTLGRAWCWPESS